MRLVRLHRRDGECVYVNPDQVLTVEPCPIYATPEGKSRVELVGQGARIFFALAGQIAADGPTADTEPYYQVVTECPREVAGLFLEPAAS